MLRYLLLFFLFNSCHSFDDETIAHHTSALQEKRSFDVDSTGLGIIEAYRQKQIDKADFIASEPFRRAGLVDVQEAIPALIVELKYSTPDNFLGFDVYGNLTKAFLQPEVAGMLATSQQALSEQRPGYRLLIYDAARPLSVQQRMWDTLSYRPLDRSKYVSNPANGGSLHNYCAAVDLTIADETGRPLDMGTPYDYFGLEAHPQHEAAMLEAGKLNATQIANRKLLRDVMRAGGFFGITSEWWHFNACTRDVAREKYTLVE